MGGTRREDYGKANRSKEHVKVSANEERRKIQENNHTYMLIGTGDQFRQ